ncbi:MAG: 2Fe-2S iron-sulfur cluster-binding protein [Gammaproteobacteria bacterium]|nr:2Fe-2S iron-sulfur cluster-binding protein [Gammaproteobacteria bacterium]
MAETTAPATVTITVDDVAYQVPAGMLLIDAITDIVGYDMPRFCHHDRLDPVGMCRMCMAEVENRGDGPTSRPAPCGHGRHAGGSIRRPRCRPAR